MRETINGNLIMKMYLNEQQTAKLIELGFENPKSEVECDLPKGDWRIGAVGIRRAYSIGELLSFLPTKIESEEDDFMASFQMTADWELYYTTYSDIFYYVNNNELIDALYNMILRLKEEGVI